jgi:hypothetical protein
MYLLEQRWKKLGLPSEVIVLVLVLVYSWSNGEKQQRVSMGIVGTEAENLTHDFSNTKPSC